MQKTSICLGQSWSRKITEILAVLRIVFVQVNNLYIRGKILASSLLEIHFVTSNDHDLVC